MCSIFQELQIVHDTGYFSALPSLEEYWQQVNMSACLSRSLPLREQEGRENSRGRGRRCLVVGCFFGFCFFWHRMRSEVCGSEVDQCVSLTAGAPPHPPPHTPLNPQPPPLHTHDANRDRARSPGTRSPGLQQQQRDTFTRQLDKCCHFQSLFFFLPAYLASCILRSPPLKERKKRKK